MNRIDHTGVALIHGAGLGGSIWSDVQERLDIPSISVDFPHRGDPAATARLTLDDYATAAAAQATSLETERVVLVAHSIGGVVALRVAGLLGDRLAGVVGVSAAIPRTGGSFLSCLPVPKRLLLAGLIRVVGTKPPESAIRAGLASDLSTDQADPVVSSFTPEARSLYTTPVEYVLPQVPRRYVMTSADKELGTDTQRRMAANLGDPDPQVIAAGHLPMVSRPDDVAAAIGSFVAST